MRYFGHDVSEVLPVLLLRLLFIFHSNNLEDVYFLHQNCHTNVRPAASRKIPTAKRHRHQFSDVPGEIR